MFRVSHSSDGIEIEFSATLDNVDLASEATKKFLDARGEGRHLFEILLLMREALTNAVLHGSRQDPEMIVRYGLQLNEKDLIMEVEDQGDGFDWKAISDRDQAPGMESESGRGLIIMKQYAQKISYNESGNRLMVTKRLRP